ncbi:hypothetical protein BB8028_0005g02000 [Beauveria bassiana]|uniref:Uncharacterized protein n=1 Tax=Beauveria bassiana TaxID=176275 RepID=A0A2S7YEQ0_BEABA|nr:hypothetical protein BB8028_0005g02000 [Beauveria bassiana]
MMIWTLALAIQCKRRFLVVKRSRIACMNRASSSLPLPAAAAEAGAFKAPPGRNVKETTVDMLCCDKCDKRWLKGLIRGRGEGKQGKACLGGGGGRRKAAPSWRAAKTKLFLFSRRHSSSSLSGKQLDGRLWRTRHSIHRAGWLGCPDNTDCSTLIMTARQLEEEKRKKKKCNQRLPLHSVLFTSATADDAPCEL